jgi:hypothetical protein
MAGGQDLIGSENFSGPGSSFQLRRVNDTAHLDTGIN